ncbi:MAG: carboxypeptidase regulatory-like domain-containing protein [Planctomycetes bacterium]|nr:carboxypeptidase regulatory-like domain-containing protein [Planctomycetota bacterium]MCB9886902.1 carboxypeptidase regulatory-like domain-containing protein [Planctomycetota bacterium]
MRAGELTILIAALGLATAAGVMLLSRDTMAEALPPAPVIEAPPTNAVAVDASMQSSHRIAADDGAIVVAATADAPRQKVDTSGWSKGILRGDIELSVNAIDKIDSLMVVVEELRAASRPDGTFSNPYRSVTKIDFDRTRTPTFEVRDVPFSEYPFKVTVYSPGLNGSSRTLNVDAEHALADDIVLSVSCGGPYTLLLRDQDGNPYPQLDVRIAPIGEPLGRPRLDATSDSYGSAIFDSVLGGDYQVMVLQNGQPLGEVQTITVQTGVRLYQNRIQGQGQTLTIPRGMPLEVRVHDPRGYGIPDARIRIQATDRLRLTQFDATSDADGRVTFPYLTPGVWQIDVTKDRYQTRAKQITVKDRTPIDLQQIQLLLAR